MSDFLDYNAIKRKIESETCSKHNEKPEFKKNIKGFEINACCEEFRGKLAKKAEKIVVDETKSAMEKMLKNAFKK
ncbi:hypothetical protein [Flavobacterium microcysteis]|uniref:Uncharacterized protein n=1 Tax=Flavobacterium microcysteis TaxID=2596891 RepID=A0A501QML1_9FLAO|nr:hypothetical protein [Flavobacterium microcysteis]TPD73752.1 hypothetical protein FJA49_00210 [Flavobacterium microcysteis]